MINIVCALPSEARPIREHFKLKQEGGCEPFQWFANDEIRLMVCGVGTQSAAAGVGYLAGRCRTARKEGWLNVGIAGHQQAPVGDAYLAHKIHDVITAERWYPALQFTSELQTRLVETHPREVTAYPANALVEMEAAAFFKAASRCAEFERIHALKIVSDNTLNSVTALTRERISSLVAARIDQISKVIADLQTIPKAPPIDTDHFIETALKKFHLSVSERIQLRSIAARHLVLLPNEDLCQYVSDSESSQNLYRAIECAIDAAPLIFPQTA